MGTSLMESTSGSPLGIPIGAKCLGPLQTHLSLIWPRVVHDQVIFCFGILLSPIVTVLIVAEGMYNGLKFSGNRLEYDLAASARSDATASCEKST